MQHIQLKFMDPVRDYSDRNKSFWSRDDYVYMIAIIQEGGAGDLWSFNIEGHSMGWQEGCLAERIGWLDIASQPELKGEWRIELKG